MSRPKNIIDWDKLVEEIEEANMSEEIINRIDRTLEEIEDYLKEDKENE